MIRVEVRAVLSGADSKRALAIINGALGLAVIGQCNGTHQERQSGRRAERECLFERQEGSGSIVLYHRDHEPAEPQRRRVVPSMSKGSSGMANGRHAIFFAAPGAHEESLMAPREQTVGAGVVGLQREGTLQ